MKLYYTPGVCSQSVHIALREAGIDHSIERVDMATKKTESGDDFLKINPLGYVPALELEDGDVLLEAPAILQYIADLNPGSALAPANGTRERVKLQEQLNFIASELHKSFGPFFAPIQPEGALREQALAKLGKRFDALNAMLSNGKGYLMGDKFTVSDTYAYVVANWAGIVGIDLSPWPKVQAYISHVGARPHVLEVLKREGLAA